MTSSTVTLRIQELAEAKGLTLEKLSEASGIPMQAIQTYITAPVELTEEIAADLRKIATKLSVAVVELVKPVAKKGAIKLKISEKLEQKGLTLEELSERSGVNPAVLAFYSTQSICQKKLTESQHQRNLTEISEALDCCTEDLQVAADLPSTRLRFQAFTEERGLTLEDISLLTDSSPEFIDLLATQPLDFLKSNEDIGSFDEFKKAVCKATGVWCNTQ